MRDYGPYSLPQSRLGGSLSNLDDASPAMRYTNRPLKLTHEEWVGFGR
jgi:hypothetical protein